MRFAEDQTAAILTGQVPIYMKLCFSLNEQVLDVFVQQAHHEDTSSQNSVLLHDFCHRLCEAQLIQMDAKSCSFVEYHADVVNTTVCCASRAKYCLGDFSTLPPTSPSFSISFSKPFTRFKTVSPRRTGASEKFRLNLQKHFLITPLFSASHRKQPEVSHNYLATSPISNVQTQRCAGLVHDTYDKTGSDSRLTKCKTMTPY